MAFSSFPICHALFRVADPPALCQRSDRLLVCNLGDFCQFLPGLSCVRLSRALTLVLQALQLVPCTNPAGTRPALGGAPCMVWLACWTVDRSKVYWSLFSGIWLPLFFFFFFIAPFKCTLHLAVSACLKCLLGGVAQHLLSSPLCAWVQGRAQHPAGHVPAPLLLPPRGQAPVTRCWACAGCCSGRAATATHGISPAQLHRHSSTQRVSLL